MFYSVLPYRIWSHFWFCCRSQLDPKICQFCTKLQVKNIKIINYINKRLVFDVRKMFPFNLNTTVSYLRQISLFIHVRFGKDKQRLYSQKNYGVLHLEEITSPFLLFKNYLDIIGKVIFNQCDKYLLPALFEGDHSACYGDCCIFSADSKKKRKLKENIYLNAVKLIRRLVVSTCQTSNAYFFIECFRTYEPNVHYSNSYLSIDRLKKRRMNNFCTCLTNALCKRFKIDAIVFVSKKRNIFICLLINLCLNIVITS